MKKIVKLTENDLERIVKKTLLKEDDTYAFRDEYSNNLERIEKGYSNDEDRLNDIVDVYQNRIKYIKDYLSSKSEDKKD